MNNYWGTRPSLSIGLERLWESLVGYFTNCYNDTNEKFE